LENLSFAFKKVANFDIVHSHTGPRALFFQDLTKTPVLHTFHNPLDSKKKKLPPVLEILKQRQDSTNVCFISKEARRICPAKIKRSWVVYNGIDLDLFKFSGTSKDELLWAGRVEHYKGIENAVKLAKMARMRINLVGKLDPAKRPYFEKKIKPYLNQKIRYLGELSQRQLVPLYQKALAFIYPIEWAEPFGLTMVEAQACGTPVIVFDRGSAREVVQDKKTGFVVPFLDQGGEKNYAGLLAALKNIRQIKREDCREFIEQNFTIEKMVRSYEKIYQELVG
jgi:glycosyltransferase involved in cell wall biosynthesis